MKKILLSVIVVSFACFSACEDSVNPKIPSQEDYAFYCIINSDTTFQTAYLSKTYDVSGLNPAANQTDPAVKNARIVITYQDTDYLFADSSVNRIDTSRYKDSFQFYYHNKLNLKSERWFDDAYPVRLTVTLPNNKVLTSTTESIPTGDLKIMDYIPEENPEVYSRFNVFRWDFLSSHNTIRKYLFLPTLEINYSKIENGTPTRKKIQIPSGTYTYNGGEFYSYPKVSSTNLIEYNKKYINDVFKKLSADDPNKGNYIIHNLMLTIVVMDKNFASLCAENTVFDSEFSIRVVASNTSNITGAYGIFGLYAKKKMDVQIDMFDIKGYGYQYEHKS